MADGVLGLGLFSTKNRVSVTGTGNGGSYTLTVRGSAKEFPGVKSGPGLESDDSISSLGSDKDGDVKIEGGVSDDGEDVFLIDGEIINQTGPINVSTSTAGVLPASVLYLAGAVLAFLVGINILK